MHVFCVSLRVKSDRRELSKVQKYIGRQEVYIFINVGSSVSNSVGNVEPSEY